MNMENFISGFAKTEFQQREVLRRVLGTDGCDRFLTSSLDVFFTDADVEYLVSLGLNSGLHSF